MRIIQYFGNRFVNIFNLNVFSLTILISNSIIEYGHSVYDERDIMTKLLLNRGLLKLTITTVLRPFIFFGVIYVINELWMNVFKLGEKIQSVKAAKI